MPIYEFYCADCNTIYKFFSRSVNTEKIPACPVCERTELERVMSSFTTLSSSHGENEGEEDFPPIDEAKMERLLGEFAGEAERLDENNPRQMASFMRRFAREAGISFGEAMEEAIRRMEKGEDPDAIEADLGEALGGDEAFMLKKLHGIKKRGKKPRIDDRLYDL